MKMPRPNKRTGPPPGVGHVGHPVAGPETPYAQVGVDPNVAAARTIVGSKMEDGRVMLVIASGIEQEPLVVSMVCRDAAVVLDRPTLRQWLQAMLAWEETL